MDDEWLILIQLLVVGSVIGTLMTYLIRSLMCKAKNEPANQAVLVTGCDSGIGHELAKHLDSLGFHVFAACLDTSNEGAQRLRIESSPMLRLVNMDVTKEDHVRHAVDYIRENLPAGQHGKANSVYFLLCNKKSRFDFADELKVGYVRYKHLTQITIKVQLFWRLAYEMLLYSKTNRLWVISDSKKVVE